MAFILRLFILSYNVFSFDLAAYTLCSHILYTLSYFCTCTVITEITPTSAHKSAAYYWLLNFADRSVQTDIRYIVRNVVLQIGGLL